MILNKLTTSLISFVVFCSQLTAGGSITGTITYEGKIPKLKKFDMAIEPICVQKHETDPVRFTGRSEALVLGDENTLGNIFVQVIAGLPKKEYSPPDTPVVIDQNGCTYAPHVLALMVGQPLKFLNSDGVLHNLHTLPEENDEFNVTMPKFLKETIRTFEYAEGMFPIKCDVHPWMGGFVAVLDHPFFAVTQKDGVYKIEGLDPGDYEIEFWHEKLGTRNASVSVKGDETQTLDFVFKR